MKKFKNFLKEQPTNNTNSTSTVPGFSADAETPVAGIDKRLFPEPIDDLDQGYQTPGESGLAKWRFANVYPVMHLNMDQIDSMVQASKEFIGVMEKNTEDVVKQNYKQFINKK